MTASPAFLSKLCDADLAALAQRWTERSYRRNELIVAHGDSGRDVFFLLAGRARVTLFSEDGREIAYRDIEPGEIFGELAGIDGKARSASVVALGTTRASRLPGAAFREIVNNHPTFAWMLLEHLSAQLRRMTDRVYQFSTLVVRKRLILELLRWAAGNRAGQRTGLHKPGADAFRAGSKDQHAQGGGLARDERACQEGADREARQQASAA